MRALRMDATPSRASVARASGDGLQPFEVSRLKSPRRLAPNPSSPSRRSTSLVSRSEVGAASSAEATSSSRTLDGQSGEVKTSHGSDSPKRRADIAATSSSSVFNASVMSSHVTASGSVQNRAAATRGSSEAPSSRKDVAHSLSGARSKRVRRARQRCLKGWVEDIARSLKSLGMSPWVVERWAYCDMVRRSSCHSWVNCGKDTAPMVRGRHDNLSVSSKAALRQGSKTN